ncbi:MAG: pseudouridine synthase [Gemmatimonadota bacterium]
MRLQKYLSRAGVASRRRSETLIEQGRVQVNGRTVTELGTRVDAESDAVSVDGRRIEPAEPVWIALHKPAGYISTRRDPRGRPTVYDLVPEEFAGLFYVGRLDRDSEGLMLLTNQGGIANRLMHPRYGVDRVYRVTVDGPLAEDAVRRLLDGVELEDGPARAVRVERVPAEGAGEATLRLTLREGRKREVRRMMRAIGRSVVRLVRERYGPIGLEGLESGGWRRLAEQEVAALSSVA